MLSWAQSSFCFQISIPTLKKVLNYFQYNWTLLFRTHLIPIKHHFKLTSRSRFFFFLIELKKKHCYSNFKLISILNKNFGPSNINTIAFFMVAPYSFCLSKVWWFWKLFPGNIFGPSIVVYLTKSVLIDTWIN